MNAFWTRLARTFTLGVILCSLLLAAVPAGATIVTLSILDGGGTSRATAWGQDGSSYYFAMSGIYGVNGDYQADVNSSGQLEITGPVTNAGTFAVQAAQSSTWNITNISGTVSLPTGAATSANQATIITALGSPMQATGGTVTAAQATAANLKSQVNVVSGGIASGAVASGAIASGALASGAGTDGWNVTEGTKADSAWVSGSGSVIALLKTIAGAGASSSITGWAGSTIGTGTIQNFGATEATIGSGAVPAFNAHVTNTNANGSATSANSSPVVIASDQGAIPASQSGTWSATVPGDGSKSQVSG